MAQVINDFLFSSNIQYHPHYHPFFSFRPLFCASFVNFWFSAFVSCFFPFYQKINNCSYQKNNACKFHFSPPLFSLGFVCSASASAFILGRMLWIVAAIEKMSFIPSEPDTMLYLDFSKAAFAVPCQ